jgi:tripartite-type tricarboxylate transporter receptor subunit TctC
MKKFMSGVLLFAVSTAVVFAAGESQAQADNYPSKPIRVIVPWNPGGGSDVLVRGFQPFLEKELGQRLVIENIGAGATVVGTNELIKAKPDGYTVLFSNEAWITRYYAKVYAERVWEQMAPIASITTEPIATIEVLASSPLKTWQDLVSAAKANPGEMTCGNPGTGSPLDIVFAQISKAADIDVQYVPFSGGGASKTALLGGHIDFRLCQTTEAVSMVKAGETRLLAVSSAERDHIFPDVPTFKEVGLQGVTSYNYIRGFWGPLKMPPVLIAKLGAAIERATKNPGFVKFAEQYAYTVTYKDATEQGKYVTQFDTEFGPMLAEMNKSK